MAKEVLTGGGALAGAAGSIIGANAEAKELRRQAAQLEFQAGQGRASAQRAAMEERRKSRFLSSRGLALAAASGGGADDPTVINNLAEIEGEGEYRALASMYEGETEARGKEAQAVANRSRAKAVKTAGLLNAAGKILDAGSSFFGAG
jgi:hypothetical protein